MKRRTALALAGGMACLLAPPVAAVGLGPPAKDGFIDGPRKGFELTLYNPYPQATDFVAYAVGPDDELIQPHVQIIPARTRLGAGMSRRLIVVASALPLNEKYAFRVCAQRAEPPTGIQINARVCSKLSVIRLR